MPPTRPKPQQPRVRIASTLDTGEELLDRIAVGTARNQKRFVPMSLGSSRDPDKSLPDLRSGDLLEISAEIEVTVDLTPGQAAENARHGGKPAGVPYDFAPEVGAQLLLADSPTATTAGRHALQVGEQRLKKVPHRLHHAVFVFDGSSDKAALTIPAAGLPWSGQSYVNVVLTASHREAKPGHIVIVGQNNFDGSTGTKMASISLVRYRPAQQTAPAPLVTDRLKTASMPLQSSLPTVVYSLPLEGLEANEQLRVKASLEADVPMTYPGRLKNEVFLADSPTQAEPVGKSYAASISSAKGKVTRGNGFNCMPGVVSRFRKAGALRITKDATRTVYLNFACSAGDPEKQGRPDAIRLLPSGFLSVARLSPETFG